MKKEEFTMLLGGINARVQECRAHLRNIQTTEDLAKLSIKDAVTLRDFCKNEWAKMNRVAAVELYHILGMGRLTAVQTGAFLSQLREYLSYRPTIQALSVGLNSIDNLPTIPAHTKFQLGVLADLELYSDADAKLIPEEIPIFEGTADVGSPGTPRRKLPYSLDGKTISVYDPKGFLEILPELGCVGGNLSVLTAKMVNQGKYFGIQWLGVNEDRVATGKVTSGKILQNLRMLGLQSEKTPA